MAITRALSLQIPLPKSKEDDQQRNSSEKDRVMIQVHRNTCGYK
jgi:hypothetical protein